MIKPRELETERGRDIWATIMAASEGDCEALLRLLERDPGLNRAQYWYTQPIHFAVRSEHLEAVRSLPKRTWMRQTVSPMNWAEWFSSAEISVADLDFSPAPAQCVIE